MNELEEQIRSDLVALIGTGNVAVVDGPLADPMVIEKRPLFEDSSLAWALERYREHARNLATANASPDSERARRPLSIVYITPLDAVHFIVEPTPARDVQPPGRTKLHVPLLQPHHVHHRHQRLGSYAISDFSQYRQHVTIFLPNAARYGAKFDGKGYRYAFDGVGYARKGKYLLVNGDHVPVANYEAQRAEVMQVQREAPVILRYSYADGLTLTGNTKLYKDRIAQTAGTVSISRRGGMDHVTYRFEWSRRQQVWYVPKSRNSVWSRAAVEEVAEALRIHGIPSVEIQYQSPREVGVEPAYEPEVREPEPTPHGWPPVPLDEATAKLMPEAQVRAVPRYTAEDYRWHDIQLGRLVSPIHGFATNIFGHLVVAHPPAEPLSRFWVLVVDGERWGRGQEDFFVLANNFHAELVPKLEPVPEPRRGEPVDDDAIAAGRAEVAKRKARSRALDDVARAAGIEVCPRAIFEIEPAPLDREQIKERADAFATLVKHYRRLHEIERWAAGQRAEFPWDEAWGLNIDMGPPTWISKPESAHLAVKWAQERYDSWLESVLDVMKPRDREQAARVLGFCVRDIAGGHRRARQGRPHSRPAEPLDLLTYQAPEPSQVVAPAPASEARVAAAAAAAPAARRRGKPTQGKDVARVATAWTEHAASRPKHERPWSNVPKTSCFVRREAGVDVTLCPTPQVRPVENCPPLVTTMQDKARRVMLCGGDEGVQFFGSVADANVEGENMALRKRLRQAPADAPWPAVDDFAAQERFLDALVPARLVFDKDWPFKLLPVEVGPPRVSAGTESADVTAWADTDVPQDAELEPQVLVGGRATGLREFVDALGDELFVYRGHASQATIDGLRKHLTVPQLSTLGRNKTANGIGHGIFGGRSLYWLGDQNDFVGPVYANGHLASGRAKEEVLERFSRPMPLPDMLPWGWTLDDSIVIAALVGGEPAWNVWNSTSGSFSHKRESQEVWSDPQRLARDADPSSGEREGDYAGAALSTLFKLIDRTPGTIRFRVAGPWLGLVFPSDYGSRVVFDPPTGGKLDLEQLERERDHHQQLSLEDADAIEDYKRAKRRVEWAQKWLSEQKQAGPPKRAPRDKPKLTVVRDADDRATAEPEPVEPSRARKLTVVRDADEPAKPTRARESNAAPTDAALDELARSLGVTRDQGHTIGNRMELLYEAEKRGWGPKMRTWLVKNRMIQPESAIEYGARARGRLAFERGEPWPPPPARGDTYSATEYAGILWSLRDSPEARAAVELGKQWTEWMKRTGAARFYRHHDMERDVGHHLETRTNAVFDTHKTPAAARARYEWMKAALDARMRTMRLSMDPALYDKSREAGQVYKTLCEISNEVAQEILEENYGVKFPDKRDHHDLCDGKQSLEDLGRKAQERDREDAARKAESNQVRLADARALLAVAEEASKRGELTERRFNSTYWRLHPEIRSGYARENRRLKLTWFPSFRQARGVAPESSDKPTEAWVRGPADNGFHARVYKAPSEVAVVEALVAEIRREAAKLEAELSNSNGDAPSPSPSTSSSKPKRARKPARESADTEPTMTSKRSSRRAKVHTPAAEPPRSKPVDAAKLRALAESMEAKANAELGTDRLENTPRRAQMAAGIRDRARRQLVLAQTLRRIADAGETGGYQYVSQVSNKADLDALETALDRAGFDRRKAEKVFEYWKRDDPKLVDIDYASYEGLRAERDGLLAVLEFTKAAGGFAEARSVLESAAKRLADWGPLEPEEIEALRELVAVVRKSKAKDIPRPVEAVVEALRDYDRLTALGVVDTPSLRAALHEYMTCCRSQTRMQKDDPIAVKKRELAFAKIPGFFPTPRPLVERMVDAAELESGMRVLEPSAGDGAIALVIRERHPDVELAVIERQVSLRELLEAQGFSLVADDFTAYTPSVLYDRILMNPPFEQKQDVEHIGHALDLLAPGGRLVAIASAGLNFRDDPKTKALRDRIDLLGGYIEPLPQGSFEASGTGASTVLVVVDNPSAAARREPAQVSTPRPQQPRSEPMSDCSADSPSTCQPKPPKGAKAKLAAEVAKQQASETKAVAAPAKKRTAKKKSSQAKPATDAKPTTTVAATNTSKKKSGKKKGGRKKAAKLPSWRYTIVRNDRYRYREVDGKLVVEREKDNTWTAASGSAARAVHEKSQSACALAAQILPTCGANKSKATRVRPTEAQKQSMRKFLGL